MDVPAPLSGVLVIRVWAEGLGRDDLRARVRATLDVASDAADEWALAGGDALVAAVSGWLDDFLVVAAGRAADAASDGDGDSDHDR